MEPDIGINFQPGGAASPEGYFADIGAAYNANRGYGWVTQASLGQATPTPIDISPNARDRNAVNDQRLDTLLHMQYPSRVNSASAVKTPAAWEYNLLNGTYEVTVSVGDSTAFDSTHDINIEGVEAIDSFVPTAADRFEESTVTVEVTDGKLTVDAVGGSNTKINYLEIIEAPDPGTIDEKINFQLESAPLPSGYIKDSGKAYSDSRGYGWITQSSVGSGTPTPLDISTYGRDRNRAGINQRLDTLVHMQYPNTAAAAWEYKLPDGIYTVTVSVGDQPKYDSIHAINVEGVSAIAPFQPSASQEYKQATVPVEVTDGKLTIDALGGSNTKINYVEIVESDATPFPPDGNPEIEIENLDAVPYADRLAFSRIGSLTSPPANGVHDVVTLRVKNTGSDPLQISNLAVTGPWEVDTAAPTTIAAGDQLDLPVRFVATSGDVRNGSLTIASNDADEPNTVVQLSGFWQRRSEDGQEPNVPEILDVFGYTTEITGTRQKLNQQGLVQAVGEEVLSPYWQQADSSEPVSVRQLAAYHSYPATARVFWHTKGNDTTNTIFVHEEQDGQSLLPRKNNSSAPAQGTFNSNGTFGFKIDPEWSDPNKNRQQVDFDNGSPGPAGHHVRFWPVSDRSGDVVEDTYIMVMDYSGINYDYNDNVYLISNIEPEPHEALYRIDVGSNSDYTDTDGNVWSADTDLFAPGNAVAENAGAVAIINTEDDLLYQTYRSKIQGSPPQDQRVLSFNLPIDSPTSDLDVRLHFAETYWGLNGRAGANQRVFDVRVEEETIMNDFDIFAEATGARNATVIQIGDVAVSDGELNLEFDPETDFASIAAIEVLKPIS